MYTHGLAFVLATTIDWLTFLLTIQYDVTKDGNHAPFEDNK